MKGSNIDPSRLFVVNTSIPWLATVTGRIGFTASPAVLLYAKGGGAWVRDNYTLTVVGGTTLATANSTSSGWTVGGGVEWWFPGNWSAFAEYNYLDFGTPGVTFTPAVRRFPSTSSRTSTASWWASITASVRSPTDGSSDRRRDRIDRAVARSPRVTRGSLFEARGVPTSTLRCGQREQPTHCITVFFSRFIYVRRESALSRPQPGRAVVVRLRPSDSTAIAV
jgi:hypothetical protein